MLAEIEKIRKNRKNKKNKKNIKIRAIGNIARSIILSLFLFCASAQAADDDFFQKQEIDVDGRILSCQAGDISGDGLIDIVLILSQPSGDKKLQAYIQRQTGRFPPTPTDVIDLDNSVSMVQLFDLDGDAHLEILLIDKSGLSSITFGGEKLGSSRQVVTQPTVFAGTFGGDIVSGSFIQTISNRPVAFIPTSDGYYLWEYISGRFRELAPINFAYYNTNYIRPVKLFLGGRQSQQALFSLMLPEIVLSDANGDARQDIYLRWPTRVSIFIQGAEGRFSSQASHDFNFQESVEGSLCQSALVDFDRDGKLDIVCCRSEGGISGAQTVFRFFDASRIETGNHTENHSISLTDACGNLLIDNFDRKGGVELVVPAIELGIMSMVKKMVSKKTDFHILIYPVDNLGRPAREPQMRKKITCYLDFERSDPTADIRINWSGDYDGDGIFDLMLANGNDELVFYRGSAEEYLESKADLVLDMPNPGDIRPIQLNNDGRSDVVVIHRPQGGRSRLTLLVTNRIF